MARDDEEKAKTGFWGKSRWVKALWGGGSARAVSPPEADDPFYTPDMAYAEAERRIERARQSNETALVLGTLFGSTSEAALRRLQSLPPSIAGLTALRFLHLGSTQVDDLAPIADLTALQTLNLDSTQVADLAPIAGLNALKTLTLDNTKVTDLAPIAGLTILRTLYLSGTQVADLAPIARLTALQALYLTGTQVADLAPIAGLTALQRLSLSGTQVADLAPIARLTALQTLYLSGTQVADLAPIAGLTSLSSAARSDTQPITRGLYFRTTPLAHSAPFDSLAALSQPASTVETINYLRRQQGLPEFFPEGYVRPERFVPPEVVREETAPPEPPLPSQGLATRYVAPPDGPIDIDRGAPLLDSERQRLAGLQAEMLEAAQDLAGLAQRSNGYASLSPTLDKYCSALNRPLDDLRDGDVELLYARGLRIQAAYDTLHDEIARDDAPPEDVRLRAPMQVLLSLHGPFLQSTSRGLQLYEQTDRDRRTREEELDLKERQAKLNPKLAKEAPETTTPAARDEVTNSTEAIASGRHPERASVAGRNTVRNYWISFSDLARRWVRSQTSSPAKAAGTAGKIVLGGAASAIATQAAAASATGGKLIAAGAAALDFAVGAGGSISMAAADFMVRHAAELREMARAGGEGFKWMHSFLDWLIASRKKFDK